MLPVGMGAGAATVESSVGALSKQQIELLHDPAAPGLNTQPDKTVTQQDARSPAFTAAGHGHSLNAR